MKKRQSVKAKKKHPKSGRGARIHNVARGTKGSMLLNIPQILLGEGILTKGSDKQAIAAALGLSERRPYDLGTN
jgi:hypothetical protein